MRAGSPSRQWPWVMITAAASLPPAPPTAGAATGEANWVTALRAALRTLGQSWGAHLYIGERRLVAQLRRHNRRRRLLLGKRQFGPARRRHGRRPADAGGRGAAAGRVVGHYQQAGAASCWRTRIPCGKVACLPPTKLMQSRCFDAGIPIAAGQGVIVDLTALQREGCSTEVNQVKDDSRWIVQHPGP